MGVFYENIGVGLKEDGPFKVVTALVDTGAVHSMLPADLLRELGVVPNKDSEFILADGRRQRFSMGDALFRIGLEEHYSPVIFGPNDQFLLGAVTLQVFSLIADTTHHKLIPAPVMTL